MYRDSHHSLEFKESEFEFVVVNVEVWIDLSQQVQRPHPGSWMVRAWFVELNQRLISCLGESALSPGNLWEPCRWRGCGV